MGYHGIQFHIFTGNSPPKNILIVGEISIGSGYNTPWVWQMKNKSSIHRSDFPIGCGPGKTCDEITPSSTMVYGLRAGRDSQRNQPMAHGDISKTIRRDMDDNFIGNHYCTVRSSTLTNQFWGPIYIQPVNLSGQKWDKLLRYTCIEWMDGWSLKCMGKVLFRDDHGGFVPSKPLRGMLAGCWLDAGCGFVLFGGFFIARKPCRVGPVSSNFIPSGKLT